MSKQTSGQYLVYKGDQRTPSNVWVVVTESQYDSLTEIQVINYLFCIRAQSRSSIILNKYWQFSHFIQPIFYVKKTLCSYIVSVHNFIIQFSMSSAETQDSSQKPSPLFSLETLSDLRISVILILQKEFGIKLYYRNLKE